MKTLYWDTQIILNRLRCAHGLMKCADDLESDGAERKDTTKDSEKPKSDPEQERKAIEERIRQIEKFERSYGKKV